MARDEAARPGAGTQDALEQQRNCWFGHTASSTPHLIPKLRSEVWSGNLQVPRWGDYCGNQFVPNVLSRGTCFPQSPEKEFRVRLQFSAAEEPSAGFAVNPEERSTIWPWQEAREE
ncbi:Hypothetical_protein [Hexamita inflata]|uniref:Hypothetical_protein n=1 Tax=Hexamita inflata TaxID=28002 RepID=A0ABP1GF03_9EUKA